MPDLCLVLFVILKQIAAKVRKILCKPTLSEQDIKVLIDKKNLATHSCLVDYIRGNNHYDFAELSKIAELANAQREDNAAYYTRQDICYTIVKSLPDATKDASCLSEDSSPHAS